MGAEPRAGAQDRIPETSLSEEQTTPIAFHRDGGVHASRDPEHAGQACNIRNRGKLQELFPNVSGAPKGRQAETCDKPEEAKPVSEDRALQDGRHSHAERPAKSRR